MASGGGRRLKRPERRCDGVPGVGPERDGCLGGYLCRAPETQPRSRDGKGAAKVPRWVFEMDLKEMYGKTHENGLTTEIGS